MNWNSLVEWYMKYRLGYIPGQTGIISRHIREQGGWDEHLEKSKIYISQYILREKPKTVRILGSGWLLDVPIDSLLESCNEIILSDIVHPNSILHRYRNNPKIRFEEVDLTGGFAKILYSMPRKRINSITIEQVINQLQFPVFHEDLVVSLNTLSQINEQPLAFLAKKVDVKNSLFELVSTLIQSKHLDTLLQGHSILISDFEEVYYSSEDKFIGCKPTLFITLPKREREMHWDWQFDTQQTYREDCTTVLKVLAVEI